MSYKKNEKKWKFWKKSTPKIDKKSTQKIVFWGHFLTSFSTRKPGPGGGADRKKKRTFWPVFWVQKRVTLPVFSPKKQGSRKCQFRHVLHFWGWRRYCSRPCPARKFLPPKPIFWVVFLIDFFRFFSFYWSFWFFIKQITVKNFIVAQ